MKRITKMFTGIALTATMLFTGIAGFAPQSGLDADSNCIVASASHSCGQFVYNSKAWSYVRSYVADGETHIIYDEYNVKRCQVCDSIKYWNSKTGRRKYVIGGRTYYGYC